MTEVSTIVPEQNANRPGTQTPAQLKNLAFAILRDVYQLGLAAIDQDQRSRNASTAFIVA